MTADIQPAWAGPILCGVVAAPDLAASVAAYRDGLGWQVRERGRLPAATARAWLAPALAGAETVLVGPDSRVGGDVRLVATPDPDRAEPLRSAGWAALEVCAPDLDAALTRLGGHFSVIGWPAALTGPAAALRAAQLVGPAGEVIYLTEIRRLVPPFRLPVPGPGPAADGVFVAVLAATDLERTRAWWEERFRVRRCTDRLATIGVLNRARGAPPGTTTRISSLQLAGRAVLEIDQYPPGTRPRGAATAGSLPPGIALIAIGVPDPETGSANGRGAMTRGPDGVLLELVPAPRPIDLV